MTIVRSPIHLSATREYVAARTRIILVIVVIVLLAIAVATFVKNMRGGAAFTAVAILIVATIGISVSSLLKKWSVVLKPDGSIDVAGMSARTIRVGADDEIAVELSPNGKWWLFVSQSTRKPLDRLPVAAFPDLQEQWKRMQIDLSH